MVNPDFKPPADAPGGGPPDDLERQLSRHLDQLRRAVLFPLLSERPLSDLPQGEEVQGELSMGEHGKRPFVARRTGEQPPSFELQVSDFPSRFEAVCVTLVQLAPAIEAVEGVFTPTYVVRPQFDARQVSEVNAFTLAADGGGDAPQVPAAPSGKGSSGRLIRRPIASRSPFRRKWRRSSISSRNSRGSAATVSQFRSAAS